MPPAAAPAPTPPAAVDVTPAKILKRVTPVVGSDVPRKAKGFVIVRFDIGENGRVSNVEVVESTPRGVFDDAAHDGGAQVDLRAAQGKRRGRESQRKARLVFEAAN